MTELQIRALIDQARAVETFRNEKDRLGERCVALEKRIEQLTGSRELLRTKVVALFNEVERMDFNDTAIYSVLDDLKQAVLNAIRRG